jgi:hypothetical protein
MRIGLAVMVLGVCGAAALAGTPPAATTTASGSTVTGAIPGIERVEIDYDVYADKDKVGKAHFKFVSTSGTAIITEDFEATYQGKEVAFSQEQVFRGGDNPVPASAKVTTRYGKFKAMDGALVFAEGSAKVSMTGYLDQKGNAFPTPQSSTKDMAVPAGTMLTHASLLYFGPRLLAAAGQKDKITWADLPLWVEYPSLVNFRSPCVLVRNKPAADGSVQFVVKQIFAGGNEEQVTSLTVDAAGRPVELSLPRYTLRLTKMEGATRTMTDKPPEKTGPVLPPPEPIK